MNEIGVCLALLSMHAEDVPIATLKSSVFTFTNESKSQAFCRLEYSVLCWHALCTFAHWLYQFVRNGGIVGVIRCTYMHTERQKD